MISVVILTWNSEKYIEKCINSLVRDLDFRRAPNEIIVIDNGSNDNTLDIIAKLRQKYDRLIVIKLKKNIGTTISRNKGIKKSRGEYLLFLDSDTEVKRGAIHHLMNTLNKDERVGIVAPRLFYADGTIQYSCKRFPVLHLKLCKYLPVNGLRRMAEKKEIYANILKSNNVKAKEVDYCISAAWLVKREAMEEIGLFDERIFYSPEDVDYCLRMKLQDWKVIYNPLAGVVHHTQRKSYHDIKIACSHFKGLLYYFKKYHYWFDREKIYHRIRQGQITK